MEEQLRNFNKELEQKVIERTDEIVKNKQRFLSLIENSADMVSIIDKDNRLSYVSPSVEKIIGIQADELARTPPYSLVHPDFVGLITALNSAIRKQHGSSKTIRLKVRHKDGHYIWIEGTITNLLDDETIRGIVNNFHDITEQVEAKEQKKLLEQALVDEKIHQQKELMHATIDGQEKEKKQIGMELHDNITQILASANIYLSVCAAGKENREQLIEKARQQIAYAISELRSLSKSLVPHGIESGGVMEAIEDIIDTARLLSEIKCHSNLSQQALDYLNPRGQLAVYRIIQEQLNNILKHAQASNINLTLLAENNCTRLCIEDDGKGFDTASRRAGIGLSNIKTRVQLLNGEMKIESAIGEGCRLFITFPAYQASVPQKPILSTKD
jgi:PAS domain S-box-containing protein